MANILKYFSLNSAFVFLRYCNPISFHKVRKSSLENRATNLQVGLGHLSELLLKSVSLVKMDVF